MIQIIIICALLAALPEIVFTKVVKDVDVHKELSNIKHQLFNELPEPKTEEERIVRQFIRKELRRKDDTEAEIRLFGLIWKKLKQFGQIIIEAVDETLNELED